MPVKDLLKYHLIDRKTKVLFVSDVDFTLTLAFATYSSQSHGLDGAWEGITSTPYAPAGRVGEVQYVGMKRVQCKPPLLASDGKQIASHLGVYGDFPDVAVLWRGVLNLLSPDTRLYSINPLALPPALIRDWQLI